MSIPTTLRNSSLISVGVLILMIPALIWSFGKTKAAKENDHIADVIQSIIFERAALRDEYLLYREVRAKNEWFAKTATADLLIQKASVQFDDKHERVSVDELRRSFNGTIEIFSRIVKNTEVMKSADTNIRLQEELEKRLVSQILLKASNLQEAANQLRNLTQEQLEKTYQRSIILTSLFVLLVVVVTLVNARIVNALLLKRVQAEDALSESEKRYRSLFDQATDGIFIIDPKGRIIEVNESFAKMHGYTGTELRSMALGDLDTPETEREVPERIARIMAGEALHFEVEHFHKDGHIFPLDVVGNRIELNGTSYILCFHRDLSDMKLIIAELAVARDASNAASKAKSEFLANMSHEIRTPMNGIMGMSELLSYTELTDDQQEYLVAIRSSSQNLLSLINNILDLSKIEAGKIDLEIAEFSLRDSIDDIVKTQLALIHAKRLVVTTDISAAIPDTLAGDQLRLKQILLNLLGNAIKFTEKGSIIVSVQIIERRGTTAMFRLSVSDTGIGIKPEAMDTIFAPFTQADASTTRRHGGTGLGLSICTKLVELMSGRIWVESRAGGGSTFHVEIPFVIGVDRVQQIAGADSAQVLVRQGPSLKILLAEDHEINRKYAVKILQKIGHFPEAAPDGKEAIKMWENGGFDLILMDIQMPVMDGMEAIKIIRKREAETGRHTPIIALTAYALHEDRELFLAAGFDGYVSKPIEFKMLTTEIGNCLPGSFQEAPLPVEAEMSYL